MSSTASRDSRWRFGEFDFSWAKLELHSAPQTVRLQQQPAKVLAVLLEHAGQVVTREDLRREVWGDSVYVDFDDALNHCVKYLRDMLGDDPTAPRYIETIPKRGYRFIAAVEQKEPAQEATATGSFRASRPRRWATLLAILVVLAAGAVVVLRLARSAARADHLPIRSIAILPLQDLSGDSSQDYFAEGITDDLTTELAQIGSVQVISRTSASHYRHSSQTLPEIGRALNVDGIVEGSVRRSGNRVRITAQLIDVRDDRHVWAGSYEEEITDVLFAQRQIASAVAAHITAQLTAPEQQRLAHRQPVDPEAYDAFLQGRYFWNQRSPKGLAKAAGYFRRAIELDPEYAEAYAALADDYLVMPFYGAAAQSDTYPRAKAAALKSVSLDPSSAEAHNAMAYALLYTDWDFAGSEREFRRAIELNPNLATAHQWYAELLSVLGRHPEALAQMYSALRLDPATPVMYHQLGQILRNAGRYQDSLEAFQHALALNSAFRESLIGLAGDYNYLGRRDDWAHTLRQSEKIDCDRRCMIATEEIIRAVERHEPQQRLEGIRRRVGRPAFYEAQVYAVEGDKDHAFQKLSEAYRQHDSDLLSLKVTPEFAPLHSDPRYQGLLKHIGFPQ